MGLPPSRDDIVTSHAILNDHGLAVPNWPVEWGGKDWTPPSIRSGSTRCNWRACPSR
jgi:hypothetical protein